MLTGLLGASAPTSDIVIKMILETFDTQVSNDT